MPEVRFGVQECIYGWTAAYEQNDTHLRVRIKLRPDADVDGTTLAACRARWEPAIEKAWSNHFACCKPPGCSNPRKLRLEVHWVSSNEHLEVRIKKGSGRSNVKLWHTEDKGGVAAHEVGHLLGHPDEYEDANCPDRKPVNTGDSYGLDLGEDRCSALRAFLQKPRRSGRRSVKCRMPPSGLDS